MVSACKVITVKRRPLWKNVSDVFGKGFEDFSEGVSRSPDKTLGKLDVEMAKASNLLAGSVEQIGESVSELDDVLSRVRA